MKSSSLIRGFLLPLMTVLGIVLWILLFWTPNRQRIRDSKAGVVFLEAKIKKDIPERQILAMKNLADSLRMVLQRKETRIYPADQLTGLGKSLQTAMKKYDLTLTMVRPNYENLKDLESDSAGTAELPAAVEMTGTFSGFTRLMDDLDNFPFAFKVNSVDLYRSKIETAALEVVLKGIVFMRKTRPYPEKDAKPADADGKKS
jgi:hypothetical protein